jgi:4-amino-4-deoxy-L-arabinose transferase-like glycosyltransferase
MSPATLHPMPSPSPAPVAAPAGGAASSPTSEPRLARLGPALAALATFALHAACWGRYGLFRDELYFMVCGERLSAGYVDQPPGIALVAGLAHWLFGTWAPGIRVFGWLATAATVYLAGRLAVILLGGRMTLGPPDPRLAPGQAHPPAPALAAAGTIAAVATFACLVLRGTSHFLSMNAFEPLLIVALVHVLVRLSRGEDPRLWVAAGGLAGLAVLFKYSSAPLSLALLLGFLVTPARRALWTPWALAGAAFGLLIVLPNFAWQASHGFPFVELVRNGVLYKNTPTTPLQFLGGVLFEANPGNAPIWLGGLAWLLVSRSARQVRFAGVGGLLYLLLLTFGHAKPYYAASLLPLFLGAGGAAFAQLVRSRRTQRIYCGVLAASVLIFSPMAVPILPVEAFVAYQAAVGLKTAKLEKLDQSVLPQVFADQFGWPELVAGIARVYRSLPPEEQARAVVLGKNYGVASAVEILGPGLGLPRGLAISGHNQYWFWGVPPGRGDPAIVVAGPQERCGGLYREQIMGEQLPLLPYVMPYENAHTIWICRGLQSPVTGLPPQLRHFD